MVGKNPNFSEVKETYSTCVIDVGSPKAGNLGWCFIDAKTRQETTGEHIDKLLPLIENAVKTHGLIIGLEAPIFVPLRTKLENATNARKGEGSRAWSAGPGAAVLATNLPIMVYLFNGIKACCPNVDWHLNEASFDAKANNIMVFEAFITGSDKGDSHVNDAQILARICMEYSERCLLPQSILEEERGVDFFNLAAAALMRCGLLSDIGGLQEYSPIYKPHEPNLPSICISNEA